jgi:hypothetical protein
MTATKLILATSAIMLMAAALAVEPKSTEDVTDASVATLKASLGNPITLEVDEVRVTDDGVACIEYRLGNPKDARSRGHAVVDDDEILKASVDAERFEAAWTEHCLGPRGGMSSPQ